MSGSLCFNCYPDTVDMMEEATGIKHTSSLHVKFERMIRKDGGEFLSHK